MRASSAGYFMKYSYGALEKSFIGRVIRYNRFKRCREMVLGGLQFHGDDVAGVQSQQNGKSSLILEYVHTMKRLAY